MVFDTKLPFILCIDYIITSALRISGFVYRSSSTFVHKVVYFNFNHSRLECCLLVCNYIHKVHICPIDNIPMKFLGFKIDKFSHLRVLATCRVDMVSLGARSNITSAMFLVLQGVTWSAQF